MRRFLVVAALLACWAGSAPADVLNISPPFLTPVRTAQVPASSFQGVGNFDTHVKYFFGIVGASSTIAATNPTAIDITNNAGTTCTGIKILATGQLDVSSGTSYCTGTVTVTSACSTNCVSGGTFRVTKWYDQEGTGATLTTSAYSASPDFLLSCANSQPCWGWVSSRSSFATSSTITSVSAPYSMGVTYERTSRFTSAMDLVRGAGGNSDVAATNVANEANAEQAGATGSPITITATDGTGVTDFSHFNTVIFTIATSGSGTCLGSDSGCFFPTGGGAPTAATFSFTQAIGTTITSGGNSSFADAFMSKLWISSAAVSVANAESITALSLP